MDSLEGKHRVVVKTFYNGLYKVHNVPYVASKDTDNKLWLSPKLLWNIGIIMKVMERQSLKEYDYRCF